ncbi:MAG TPA: GTP cyclohydrolase FolE2 [bacterium]|nr:GTP cyclohydrolase FolE2 [bacterium]
MSAIEDTQGRDDFRKMPIQRVGIKNLKYPLTFINAAGRRTPTVAMWGLAVDLPHDKKGTHMSRFGEILNAWQDGLSIESMPYFMNMMRERLHADRAFARVTFAYFIEKEAPVTLTKSFMDYTVAIDASSIHDKMTLSLEVQVPVTTLCPCSKSISEYGAHNQRSLVTVKAECETDNFLSIEELVYSVETCASSELYVVLKREDEKYVTERAYDHPAFVEDLVRDIAIKLSQDARIVRYRVDVTNLESIHNHDAYAVIESQSVSSVLSDNGAKHHASPEQHS